MDKTKNTNALLRNLLWKILWLGVALLLSLPLLARNKKQQKITPNQLTYMTTYLSGLLSGQVPLARTKNIFVSLKDLRSLGITEKKLGKIQKPLQKKYQNFHVAVRKYQIRHKNSSIFLKRIELGEVEYLKILGSKEILALKSVILYFKRYDNKKNIGYEVAMHFPAILLINGKWKISELKKISPEKVAPSPIK